MFSRCRDATSRSRPIYRRGFEVKASKLESPRVWALCTLGSNTTGGRNAVAHEATVPVLRLPKDAHGQN
jgi:hypothetical protein